GSAVAAARELGSSVAGAVKGILNIHSPSRVMRDLGIHTGQGLVKGIGSMENPVYRAAKEMAVIVKDAFDSLSEGIVLGDVSMGTVSGPVIPMVSAGYKTPSSISNVSSTSGFSGATLSKSTNESRPSNNVQNATPAVIENVIVIDS
ncbi:carbamoyl-phosphate synthase, partial [Klebsiella pneumoniae]|nr:carbamoyl-phosphate synthase [Klebsiella pneumoniae]